MTAIVRPLTNEELISLVRKEPQMSGLLKEALCRSLERTSSSEAPPTTASASPIASTREDLSDAAELASTGGPTQPSSPHLGQQIEEVSSHVALCSVCQALLERRLAWYRTRAEVVPGTHPSST